MLGSLRSFYLFRNKSSKVMYVRTYAKLIGKINRKINE